MSKTDWGRVLKIIGNVENTTLYSEVNLYRDKLTENEKKNLLIVEKQHVAGFKYDKVISEIIDYIDDYIFFSDYNVSFQNGKKGWEIKIPLDITKKIDFIKELTINITVVDDGDNTNLHRKFGSGATGIEGTHKINDGKLNSLVIEINGVTVDDELVDYSIRNGLYHELNHAYEVYRRMIRYNETGNFKDHPLVSASKADNVQKNLTGDKYGKAMEDIFYRLWDKSELSAASTSVYAYLKSVGGRRENLAIDLQQTQAFLEYEKLKKKIQMLNEYHDKHFWDEYKKLYDSKEMFTPQAFKNWFIKRSNVFLSNYYHYMLSAAAMYYDETEELISNKRKLEKLGTLKKK